MNIRGVAGAFGASLLCVSGAALAAPIPEPVIRMITEAARSGDAGALAITTDLAKRTNPNSLPEIDMLVAGLQGEAEAARVAALRDQDFLEGWSGEGEIGATLTSGTSENTTVAAGVTLTKESLEWRHTLTGIANYQKSDGVTTANRFLAGYEANYKFSERFWVLGLLQWEQDEFAGFTRRFTESLGLGYSLIDTPELVWDVSAGPAFRQTRYVTGGEDSDIAARAATHLLWNLAAGTVLTEDAGVYLGGSSNTYYSTTALTSQLIEDISARISFSVVMESNPPPGIAETNTITRFTLVYSF